jgi:cytochrome c556
MIKGFRLGAGVVAILGIASIAYAQMVPAGISARQDAMKGQGAAAAAMTKMVRGETPWDQAAAVTALTTINATAKKIPDLFKENVAAPADVKNDALPAIWANKADLARCWCWRRPATRPRSRRRCRPSAAAAAAATKAIG